MCQFLAQVNQLEIVVIRDLFREALKTQNLNTRRYQHSLKFQHHWLIVIVVPALVVAISVAAVVIVFVLLKFLLFAF